MNNGAEDIAFLPAGSVRDIQLNADGGKGAEGEDDLFSDDSIDDGDKWLNEFKMRRKAIIDSHSPAAKEEKQKRLEAQVQAGRRSDEAANENEREASEGDQSSAGQVQRQSGWIWKRGRWWHSWKRRWFVIDGSRLDYYENEKKGKALGSMDLRGSKAVTVKNEKQPDKFSFSITLSTANGENDVKHFYCDLEIERIRWLLNLEEASELTVGKGEGERHATSSLSEDEKELEGLGGNGRSGGGLDDAASEESLGAKNNSSLSDALESLKNDTNDEQYAEAVERISPIVEGDEDAGCLSIPTLEHLASSDDFHIGATTSSSKLTEIGRKDRENGAVPEDGDDNGSTLSSLMSGGIGDHGSEIGHRVGEDGEQEVKLRVHERQSEHDEGGQQYSMSPANEGSSQNAINMATLGLNSPSSSYAQHTGPNLNLTATQVEPNLLQSNYDTLLSMLREERSVRNKMNDKIANLEHTLLETSTSYQLDIDDLKKEKGEYERKFRKLSKESAYKEVFEQFEDEIRKLRKECDCLKDENIRLEMKGIDRVAGERGGEKKQKKAGGGSAATELHQPPMKFQDGLMKQLTRKNRQLEAEARKLREQNAELKQHSRLLNVSRTQNQHSQSSMLRLDDELRQSRHKASALYTRKSKLEALLMQTEKEAAQWRQSTIESQAREEKLKCELSQAAADVLKFKELGKKNNLVQRFLDKHAPRPPANSDRKNKVGNSSSKGDNQRGEGGGGLHETLQELAGQIRRVQPNLMGLIGKISNEISAEDSRSRARERDLLNSMIELLQENAENLSKENMSFKQRKLAIKQNIVMTGRNQGE